MANLDDLMHRFPDLAPDFARAYLGGPAPTQHVSPIRQLTPACDACGDRGCPRCPDRQPGPELPYDVSPY